MAVSRIDEAGLNVTQYGNRNLIINGAMQVAQRGTSATVSDGSNEGYSTVDRFYLNFNNAVSGAIDMSQSTDAPDGFSNSVKLQCSTTNTTFTTTMNVSLQQRIEAQNLQQLAYGTSSAKNITLSWYMKAVSFSDPISVTLYTQDGTPEYFTKSFTPTTSWARYTLTFPPSTSATINNDNGAGFILQFVIAGSSGGTYAAAADSTAWSTTRADYRDDIGNFTSSTSNELYITGVQLEVGDTATGFEHRSYADELQRCKRYFNNIVDYGGSSVTGFVSASAYGSGQNYGPYSFPVEMRASPALSYSSLSDFASRFNNNTNPTAIGYHGTASKKQATLQFSATSTAGQAGWFEVVNSSGYMYLDAEL